MIFEFIKSHWEYISAVSMAILTIIMKFTDSWPRLMRFFKWMTSPFTILHRVNKCLLELSQQVSIIKSDVNLIQGDISSIKKELRTNGGGSLKDAIIEIRDLAHLASTKANLSFNSINTAIYECNQKTGEITYTNKKMQELFGAHSDELVGKGWLSCLHPDDIHDTWNSWESSLHNDIPYKIRYRIINKKTQEEYCIEMTAITIRNTRGTSLSIWGECHIIQKN